MPSRRRLQFNERTVTKSGNPRLIRVEIEKTRRGGRIGKETGLFRVPEVLDFDEAKGVATVERILGIRTLRELAPRRRDYVALGERLGIALAAIHRDLRLPPDMVTPVPPDFSAPGDDVFLHGDFGLKNICLDADGTLVILDWQFTDMHGGEATYGSRYFDVIWFVNTLLWIPTLGHLVGDPVRPVARKFIESYYLAAGVPYDGTAISAYAERFFELKRPQRRRMSRRRYFFIPRCHALTRRFVRSLRTDIFS